MHARAANLYRTVHVESARPSQVLDELLGLLLGDCRRAAEAIASDDAAAKGRILGHAMRVVSELSAALDHATAPGLCKNLASLYGFINNRLGRANAERDPRLLEEVEAVVTVLREAFREAARR